MRNLKDYLNRIDLALKKLEENKVLIKEAQEIKELKKNLEFEIIKLKKQKSDSEEFIDQAIKEIEILRKNKIKKVIKDG
jgi:putative N-acetylmannosamine-6-phosphate epimerase